MKYSQVLALWEVIRSTTGHQRIPVSQSKFWVFTMPAVTTTSFSLHRLSRCVLEFIKEVNNEIYPAKRIDEKQRIKILIAEAMYRDIEILFSELNQKMHTYQPDDL